MRDGTKQALIAYGLRGLAEAMGQQSEELIAKIPDRDQAAELNWTAYENVLHGGKPGQAKKALTSILSLVPDEHGRLPDAACHRPAPLSLQTGIEAIFPPRLVGAWHGEDTSLLWAGFESEYKSIPWHGEIEPFFEVFYHLYQKYAWAVPCTYGEEGVSLFEQWKAVAALVFASGGDPNPASTYLLVGGDIPGIQDFVYTITSKGAVKGLRGRSFFLQLLSDAVVRRLVADLGLCPANVICAAGGNFTILAPAGSEKTLQEWQARCNHTLLEEFEGDLYLALGWRELPRSAVGTRAFTDVREQLAKEVATAKNRAFAEVVGEHGWNPLFEPQGRGGDVEFCDVCQQEPRSGERLQEETTSAGETLHKCSLCRGFEELARDIAHDDLWMVVAAADQAAREDRGWRGSLVRLTGYEYRFEHNQPQATGKKTVYSLNDTGFIKAGAHGFRFVANVTPRVTDEDRRWAQEQKRERGLDLEIPETGSIKDFDWMAYQSQGIQRVGVLRMDVDNLGAIFGQRLRGSMAQVSALSAALDLFFAGYLNRICDGVNGGGKHPNVLYTIYAGGDDLFAVGAWDRMPVLAERVRENFRTYAGGNPGLTLSGGITLEDRKFPLYRAAERAGEAEARAKAYERPDERKKDALCFLGQVVGWEEGKKEGKEWTLVREWKDELLWLVGEDADNQARAEDEREARLPRGLLQTLRSIDHMYRTGLKEARKRAREKGHTPPEPQVYLGRWTWMLVYSLARMARRARDEQVAHRLLKLQKAILLRPEAVPLGALAARWAEYLLRERER